ncbi:MAG: high-potential iron-sulfur protein [Granulosicoccus sp.]|nr:high-potential iron-sulfur protein [Granulosicoccus sp.]
MKNQNINRQRRQFLTTAGAAAVVIPVTALVGSRVAYSADMVDPKSAQAMALKYIAKSETESQTCGNCALYTAAGDEAGNCPLFQGAQVGKSAWCSAWAARG